MSARRDGLDARAVRLLVLAAIVAAVGCSKATAPRPPKVHTGLCTIVYTYLNDRADPSKGAVTIRLRPIDNASCPDEVTVVWDDGQ